MDKMDLIIKNGIVVGEHDCTKKTIAIKDGRIAGIFDEGAQIDGIETIDATDLMIMPGAVDAHSHIWEPTSYEYREDFFTGTCAAASGGITTIIEMPLSIPPVFDKNSFDIRLQRAKSRTVVDFALWGSFISEAMENFGALDDCGCVGYKAFLSYANPNYPFADDYMLLKGMEKLSKLGGIVGVHAENFSITEGYSKEFRDLGFMGGEYHEKSRPDISELLAIQKSMLLAQHTGCRLHICHLSTAMASKMIKAAMEENQQVTVETCPHYLTLSVEDLKRCGGFAKCNPPLRSEENREKLWQMIRDGEIHCIATDHTTYTDDDREKYGKDIWSMPAGIGGSDLFLPLLLDEGYHKRKVPLTELAKLTAGNPAKIFGIYPQKGAIQVGADGDLTFVDLSKEWIYQAQDSLSKAKCINSPYQGRKIKGKVIRTMVRGVTVYCDGEIKVKEGVGQLVRKK